MAAVGRFRPAVRVGKPGPPAEVVVGREDRHGRGQALELLGEPQDSRANRFMKVRIVRLCRSTWLVQIVRSEAALDDLPLGAHHLGWRVAAGRSAFR